MKIINTLVLALPLITFPCIADVMKYCEDGEPYTEARKDDPTCHDISSEWSGGDSSNSGNSGGNAPSEPAVAGGGGCGSSARCGEHSYTTEGTEPPSSAPSPSVPETSPNGWPSSPYPSRGYGNGGYGSGGYGGGGYGGGFGGY